MIGKMIGAFVGDKLAKQTKGMDGATGAVLGLVATAALRRMSLPVMVVLGVGGYVAKKYFDKDGKTVKAEPATANADPVTGVTTAAA